MSDVYRDTCYGFVTDEEYQRRVAADRLKAEQRAACTLCDADGYRGRIVCDHIDRSGMGARIRREVRKRRFTVIDGG